MHELISRDGGINIFQDTESGLKYLATLRPPSSPRLFCLASGGPPGSLSVIAGGLEGAVVLWSQALRGEVAAKVLRLAEGVDSASEGETDFDISEDEGEVLSGGGAFDIHNNNTTAKSLHQQCMISTKFVFKTLTKWCVASRLGY